MSNMAASLPWFCLILIAGRPVFVFSVRGANLTAPTALRKSDCRAGREGGRRARVPTGTHVVCGGTVNAGGGRQRGAARHNSIAFVDSGSQRSKTMVNL